jgi:hypothetical protein
MFVQQVKLVVALFILCFGLHACAPSSEKIIPELVIDVPDEIKPAIKNVIVRVTAKDLMPFEADVVVEQEFAIPSGKDRIISATVLDAHGTVRATGITKCNISSTERTINLKLLVPPTAPDLHKAEIVDNNGTICWSGYQPAEGRDFAAYKLYRANFADVSEICELVKEIKDRNDTMWVDKSLDPFQDYYYRVFVFEKQGCFNGSNQMQAVRRAAAGNQTL